MVMLIHTEYLLYANYHIGYIFLLLTFYFKGGQSVVHLVKTHYGVKGSWFKTLVPICRGKYFTNR